VAIQSWTDHLSGLLIAGGAARGLKVLGPTGPGTKAPTTAFACQGDSHVVEVGLRARGILASARGPAIRLAPHFYSTAEDVDRALDALVEVTAAS
jgi:selenocysteine lyase/cysteine desulfurase